jgi:hypothetical protein
MPKLCFKQNDLAIATDRAGAHRQRDQPHLVTRDRPEDSSGLFAESGHLHAPGVQRASLRFSVKPPSIERYEIACVTSVVGEKSRYIMQPSAS